jgi:hypothetical protein
MLHRERLDQARQRLEDLEAAARQHLATRPIRLVHEHDMRAGEYRVRAEVVTPVPVEILAVVEEIARTLRAALDDLATALAGATTRFPIFESLPSFAQRSRKALSRMPDEAQAAIESLQPYHAIGGYRNGPLWLLDQLAGAERPRLAAGAVLAGAELGVNTRRNVEIMDGLAGELAVPAGAFDDGAVIASVQTRVKGPDPKLDMFLRAELGLAFERRGVAKGREVVALLGELCEHVAMVFAELEPSLPG